MSLARHLALIHVVVDVAGGVEAAKSILKEISNCGNISAISSIYKRFLTSEAVDLSARLELVVCLETTMSVDQTLHMVCSQCNQGAQGLVQKTYADLTLLAFDDIIQMSPRLTLPHPLLHQDPLVIRCAAEVRGKYEHPIYQKNLNDISRLAPPAKQVEFYMQGKSLVDF